MPFYAIAIILTIIAGLTMWFVSVGSLIGYAIGIASGMTIALAVVRKLGKKSKSSSRASTLFYKLTQYKARVYHVHSQKPETTTATVYGDGHEYADLVDILKGQMRFPVPMAKGAAKFAMDTTDGEPFEEKIRVALQYLGNGHKDVTTGA